MDDWARHKIESGLAFAIRSEGRDNFAKAQKFLRHREVADADFILENIEEIEAIFDRLKLLPPSPPSSEVSPADKSSCSGEDDQGAQSSIVPEYDREIILQPIAIFVPNLKQFRTLNSKRCKSKFSYIKAASVRLYGLSKEHDGSVLLNWQYPNGFIPPGLVQNTFQTRCRVIEDKDAEAQQMQVEVLLGEVLQCELQQDPGPAVSCNTNIPAPAQTPIQTASINGQSLIRTDQIPSPLAVRPDHTMEILGQLNAQSAVYLGAQGYVPCLTLPFQHGLVQQAASMQQGFNQAQAPYYHLAQPAYPGGVPQMYMPQTQALQPYPYQQYVPQIPQQSHAGAPQPGHPTIAHPGIQSMAQPMVPVTSPFAAPNLQTNQSTSGWNGPPVYTAPSPDGSILGGVKSQVATPAYASFEPHHNQHEPNQPHTGQTPNSVTSMNSDLEKIVPSSSDDQTKKPGVTSIAFHKLGSQFPEAMSSEQPPAQPPARQPNGGGVQVNDVRAGQDLAMTPP